MGLSIMKEIQHPPYLRKGDKTTIISPSGNIDLTYIDGAKKTLENWGLEVNIAPFALEQYGRFGGTPEQRLSDLQVAMDDKDTRLILCSRGGYGIVQIMDKLNFSQIKKYPKWLVGFSDITALHLAFLQNNLSSLHASMARHLTERNDDEISNLIKQCLFSGGIDKYEIPSHLLNRKGKTDGCLFGGNLAVLCGLIGTPYMNPPKKGILFIEDIGESPYKIDRMMWQLKLSGILQNLSGLIVGQFTDCNEDPLMGATIYESIQNMVSEYDFPVMFNFPVGHIDNNYPLVHGSHVEINIETDLVTIESKN